MIETTHQIVTFIQAGLDSFNAAAGTQINLATLGSICLTGMLAAVVLWMPVFETAPRKR